MKKFTLFAAAAIVALTASAKIEAPKATNGFKTAKADIAALMREAYNPETRNLKKATPKADDTTPTVITEQPEGELVQYNISGGYTYANENGAAKTYVQSGIVDIVFSEDDNTVWMKNPLNSFMTDAWIVGEAINGGSTLSFPVGQYIYYSGGLGLRLYMCKAVTENIQYYRDLYAIDEAYDAITYTVNGNTITLDNVSAADAETNDYGFVDEILGGWFESSTASYWYVTGDWGTEMTLFELEDEPVTLPDGLTTEEFNLTGTTNTGELSQKINVAFDGSDVYIQDFTGFFPEGWIKGTIGEDGTTVKFEPQYLGMYNNTYIMYLVGATYESGTGFVLTEDSGFEFEYDAEARTLSQVTDYIIVSGGKTETSYYAYAYDLFISNEGPATPAAPTIISWTAYDEATGSGSMTVQMPIIDTEGNALLIKKLQYKLYSDIERDTTAVTAGFTLSNVEQFDNTSLKLTFTTDATTVDFNNVGFSAIYTGGLESHESEIAWYHIKDYAPTATVGDLNNDGSIDGNDVSALLEMVLAGGVSDEQKSVADVTGDGSVDGNDVSALLEVVLAGGGSGE